MAGPIGITEKYWLTMSEDRKLYWKFSTRLLTIVAAFFFVSKTGMSYFDWSVSTFSALLATCVIETQRTYSRLSPKLRKWITRRVIFLGSWSITILGVALFSQVGIGAVANVARESFPQNLRTQHPELVALIFVIALIAAAYTAIIRSFRDLHFEELIYDLPNHGLRQLLVHKRFLAEQFPLFAGFELMVLVVSLNYCSMVAEITKAFIMAFGMKV